MAITSFAFDGANWNAPDPLDSKYWECLHEAYRCKVAGVGATVPATLFIMPVSENKGIQIQEDISNYTQYLRVAVVPQYYNHVNYTAVASGFKTSGGIPTIPTINCVPTGTDYGLYENPSNTDNMYYITAVSGLATPAQFTVTVPKPAMWTWDTICEAAGIGVEDLLYNCSPMEVSNDVYISNWMKAMKKILELLQYYYANDISLVYKVKSSNVSTKKHSTSGGYEQHWWYTYFDIDPVHGSESGRQYLDDIADWDFGYDVDIRAWGQYRYPSNTDPLKDWVWVNCPFWYGTTGAVDCTGNNWGDGAVPDSYTPFRQAIEVECVGNTLSALANWLYMDRLFMLEAGWGSEYSPPKRVSSGQLKINAYSVYAEADFQLELKINGTLASNTSKLNVNNNYTLSGGVLTCGWLGELNVNTNENTRIGLGYEGVPPDFNGSGVESLQYAYSGVWHCMGLSYSGYVFQFVYNIPKIPAGFDYLSYFYKTEEF